MTTLSSASGATGAASGGAASGGAAPAANPAEKARLHQAAQAFEAIFVRQMLSSARQSNFGDTLWGDDKGKDTFTAMRDERFADLTAQSGALGLAKQVEAQLSGQSPATAGPAAATGSTQP
ncbi:rod-binding protein [Novosphingobium sp. Fuku2-ISO-50]|uniref:rod-binding protein n=1 Tax=Novosphingobium sp. Fuku2-ISO-50 TaxID=1739114 RepID=UPI00076D4C96|nr:rod-binding protein [Novosphingobium sp. Fuku2-ISO-50]KUR74408.1 peptidoglycan hydrolase [Novosphingobium sp. Fuku2-ISO-50]